MQNIFKNKTTQKQLYGMKIRTQTPEKITKKNRIFPSENLEVSSILLERERERETTLTLPAII
jgi:hypothetical protein